MLVRFILWLLFGREDPMTGYTPTSRPVKS